MLEKKFVKLTMTTNQPVYVNINNINQVYNYPTIDGTNRTLIDMLGADPDSWFQVKETVEDVMTKIAEVERERDNFTYTERK